MTHRPATLVVGLGNRDRGDDAVGLLVADALRRGGAAAVATHEGTDLDLLEVWAGVEHVILVDAARTGYPVGTIRWFDADDPALRGAGGGSSHAFGLSRVLELGRALGRLPARIEVVTVTVAGAGRGGELSPAVAAAAASLAEELAVGSGGVAE